MNPSLQPLLLPDLVRVLIWAGILLTPLVAWFFTSMSSPRVPEGRWARGAIPIGSAVICSLLIVGLVRVGVWAGTDAAGGPLGWLVHFTGFSGWHPIDVLTIMGIVYAALFFVLSQIAAWLHRRRQRRIPLRLPLPGLIGWVALACALVVLLCLDLAFRGTTRDPVLLDLAATLPMSTVALAIWSRSRYEPPEPVVFTGEAALPALPHLDPPAQWRRIGAISASGPIFGATGHREAAHGGWAATAWSDAGALGPPPRSLEEISAAWREPGQGWIIGDLPHTAEQTFVCASLLLAIRKEGLPSLVITEDPKGDRDRLERALRSSGAWSHGALVAGSAELRDVLAGSRLPAVTFISVFDLSAEGIRLLFSRSGASKQLCRSIGLVVLPRVDHGAPISIGHRFFTLRRLSLALRAASVRWSVLATGLGGAASGAMVERAFPGLHVRRVPFAPRAAAEVQVWPLSERFADAPGRPWAERALAPLIERGASVSVGDPGGAFDRSVKAWVADVELVRGVSLGGAASASALNAAWLIASFRALGNRVPLRTKGSLALAPPPASRASGRVAPAEARADLPLALRAKGPFALAPPPASRDVQNARVLRPRDGDGAAVHHALWSLDSSPIVRFLIRDPRNLPGLQQQGQLPPPRPLVAYANPLLARAHLEAALQEGEQDLESLRGLFGRALVDRVVGELEDDRFVLRSIPSQEALVRTPLVPSRQGTWSNPVGSSTLTEQVVQVVDRNGGRVLAEEDERLVATRYYPGRIVTFGDARYRVPLHALDTHRKILEVETAPDDRPSNKPRLRIVVHSPSLVEAPQQVAGVPAFVVATYEATAVETVDGILGTETTPDIRYDPVESSYRTRVRSIFFQAAAPPSALLHLARSFDDALLAHLLAADDDIHVIPAPAGFQEDMPAGLLVVDRHVQGMGVAEALEVGVIEDVLRWVSGILSSCTCRNGCRICTPHEVLGLGPDKEGALRLLGR